MGCVGTRRSPRLEIEWERVVYAVVKSGGRQYRVTVGDVLEVNRLTGQRGDTVTLPAVLVVDGDTVTSTAGELTAFPVTGEVLDHPRGPKIRILKFKNKTGYRKHQGHRQELTRLKVTAIGPDQPAKTTKLDKPAKSSSVKAGTVDTEKTQASSGKQD